MASPQGGLERQLTTPKPTQSHARCSFTASHAEIRHIAALISNWSTTPTPAKPNPIASSEPATIAPELTILFAATVRAVWSLGTVVFRSEEHTSELQSLMRTSYAV